MKIDAKKAIASTRFRRKPLITALEPRLLLDGAAVATAIDLTTDVAYQDQATSNASSAPSADLPHAGPVAPENGAPAAPESNTGPGPAPTDSVVPPVVAPVADPAAPANSSVSPTESRDGPESATAVGATGSGSVVVTELAASESNATDLAAAGSHPSAEGELPQTGATHEVSPADPAEPSLTDEAIAPVSPRREVAFVDTQAEDYQVLVDSVPQGMEVHLINGDSNGLQQIADALQGQAGIDAIHVYSHGEQGQLNLGNLTLNGDNVRQYTDLLAQIGQSLNSDADLMLYGCYVGADNAGQHFVNEIADLTGADVAASEDLTGSLDKGGDWNLEISVGSIETAARAPANYHGLLSVPGVTQFSNFTYTEDSGTVLIDPDVAINGSGNFFGGYVDFALSGSTTYETLGINRVANAATGIGAISVVGNTVFRGDGSSADVIGNVDSVLNGQNGQALRINFANSFQNGAFQTGNAGDTVITGWSVQNGRIRLDGSYQIAGQATPVDTTYSSGNNTGDFTSGGSFSQTTNLSSYDAAYAGDLALELNTGDASVDQPFGVIRGPAVYSNASVALQAGDQVSFQWKALSGGDAYDAYGYLLNVDTGHTITILNTTATTSGGETSWATVNMTINAGNEGNYRFVFVAGSFDLSGGKYLGGKLMIDDVTVTQANPPMLSGADVAGLSHLVNYSNTDQDFGSATRTLTLTVKDGTVDTAGSGNSTITLNRVNDAPSFTSGATLGAVAEDASNPAGSTVSALFGGRFSDPDAVNTPADTLGGVAVVADASNSAQGSWEYSTNSGTDWHAIGSVSNDNALVLSASSLIRFIPSADWNGTPGSLSVHAVDSTFASGYTAGAGRSTFDTTSDSNTSPVSASAVTLGTSVTAVNDAPVAGDNANSAVESGGLANANAGSGATGNVLGNDSDVDTGDTRSVSGVRSGTEAGSGTAGTLGQSLAGSYGSLTLTSAGTYTYVVNENNAAVQALRISGQTLTDSFTYTLRDAGGLTDQATLSITIDGRNDNPVGVDDTATAVEAGGVFNGTAGADATGNVLDNDTDVDSAANGETRTVTTVRTGTEAGSGTAGTVTQALTGTYGSLTLNANGSYTYAIDESNTAVQALRISGQTVSESFTYTVTDAGGLTDQAMLTVTIDGRNDNPVAATDDASVAVESGGLSNGTAGANATGNVLSNDSDVDSGDTQVVSAIRTGAEADSGTTGTVGQSLAGNYGSLTIDGAGAYTYVIDESNAAVQALRISGQTLTDSFTYTVRDTGGLTDQATLSITIDGRNDNPVGVDDTATAVESGGVFNGTAGADATGNVLDNDTDVDSAANGETKTVTTVRTGTEAGSGTAGTVAEALTGTYGSLTLNANGSYSYVIDESNTTVQALRISGQTVSESFTYTVTDAGGLTGQAMLTVTIDGRNDNPVAVDDAATAVEAGAVFNGTVGADATGNVLDNDTDVDSVANGETRTVTTVRTGTEAGSGTAGTVTQALTGTYGSLTLNTNGSYSYAIDESNTAVQALRISGQSVSESFTYTVTDTGGLTDQATLTITIDGRNDNPVGVDDTATAVESGGVFNGTAGADATGNVLDNDTDADSAASGETKTVTTVRTGTETGSGTAGTVAEALTGTYGSLTLNANGSYTYAIDEANTAVQALRISGQTVSESFTYTVTDSGGLTDQATLTITIDGRNDNPVGFDDTATAMESGGVFNGATGSHATGNVLDNDSDVDSVANGETRTVTTVRTGREAGSGTAGTVTQALTGTYGSLTLNTNGSYSYAIDESNTAVQALRISGQTVSESFTYTVTDTGGLTDQATLTVTIDGRNDNPVANDDTGTAREAGGVLNGSAGANAVGNVLTNDTDVDAAAGGETQTVTAVRGGTETALGLAGSVGQAFKGTYGSLTLGSNGSYTYVVDDNNPTVQALRVSGQTLSESFVYTVTDAGGLSDDAKLTITIEGQNDAPVVTGSNIADQVWAFGKPFSLDVSTPFSDVDGRSNGENLSFTIAGLPAGLTYDPGSGVISGSPSGIGSFVVRITASDQAGASITREFSFEVLPPPTQDSPQTALVLPVAPAITDQADTAQFSIQTLGATSTLPSGVVSDGLSADPVLDVGYLSGSGAFDGAAADGAQGNGSGAVAGSPDGTGAAVGTGTEAAAGDGVGKDAATEAGAGDGAQSSLQGKEPGNSEVGTERMLMLEGTTRASEFIGPEGKVLSVKVSIQVDVGANGEVVFTDNQKEAFDIVGLSVTGISRLDSGLLVGIFDQASGKDSQFYTGELGNGDQLPSWIRVDAKTGELSLDSPPTGLDGVTVRIKAIGSDGKVRILELSLDLNDLLKRKPAEAQSPADSDGKSSAIFSPLSDQVAAAIAQSDSYGQRLVAMVESA